MSQGRCLRDKAPLWSGDLDERGSDECATPSGHLGRLCCHTGSLCTDRPVLGRPAGPTRAVDPKVPQPGQQDKIFPLGSSWVAVSLNGRAFGGERPTFSLDDQLRARGFGGCNNYSATTYPLREQGMAVGPFALTKKSCDKAAMASEQAFLVALRTPPNGTSPARHSSSRPRTAN